MEARFLYVNLVETIGPIAGGWNEGFGHSGGNGQNVAWLVSLNHKRWERMNNVALWKKDRDYVRSDKILKVMLARVHLLRTARFQEALFKSKVHCNKFSRNNTSITESSGRILIRIFILYVVVRSCSRNVHSLNLYKMERRNEPKFYNFFPISPRT